MSAVHNSSVEKIPIHALGWNCGAAAAEPSGVGSGAKDAGLLGCGWVCEEVIGVLAGSAGC